MMLSGHLAYVAAAYAVTVLVIAGLIGWIVVDQRRQQLALRELEGRGVRRRSAGSTDKP